MLFEVSFLSAITLTPLWFNNDGILEPKFRAGYNGHLGFFAG
jgi:hypothetical protein